MNHKISSPSLENLSYRHYANIVPTLKKTDWHLVHIGSRLNLELFFFIKATAVSLKRKTCPHCVELWPEEANKLKMVLSSIYNVNHQCQSPFNWSMLIEKFQLIFHGKPITKDMHPILPS
ncbi:hypothetical protein H3T50_00240 [Commensalibacter sp. M0134]|uniref:hypothetical protein n=1 Tax=Commensalibacter TaxID=1079922 RepID=UPI0018DE87EE|nr:MULTISPECIES: hypothetical protein [Commensalibacter]MBI0065105.1 hypothetical protein [Commensalibacter sp. M0134]MBI0070602.1 hypothetical protein [Commensalibacter sp. M0133]MBI0081410.1 hypothetical protein [Commensalibacter melissae]